jgi:hypothetical protein
VIGVPPLVELWAKVMVTDCPEVGVTLAAGVDPAGSDCAVATALFGPLVVVMTQ